MNKSYVFFENKIVDESNVNISIRNKALNYGLACFEGIRAYWDEETQQLYAFRLKEHYERLLQSCKALYLDIPYTVEELINITVELLRKNNFKTTTYIRPLAYKGSNKVEPTLLDDDNRLLIYCMPMGSYAGKDSLRVAITSWSRIEDNMIPARTKPTAAYLNSGLASLEVLRKGYDEALFLTRNGHVCEGPGENIFMVRKGKLVTPPSSDNILEGITRDTVMLLAKEELGMEVVERSITRTELYAADELFFSGTAMEVTAISEVDDRKIGNGNDTDVCRKLQKLFSKITTGKLDKYSEFCTKVY
ncbi:branched-chain amino acid transaminase [Clostridium botulinum]|uniref:branched-chain amino acid transaminase n=1 Tax=Clostridium botulinum TaxID=1491 RepID=UPI0006A4AAF7|nr:branched-chain amino acid transaminase [Clostridium botulinum]KOC52278.1 branched-chain amino acid aminotransferase [Clostridium botulinum]KOC56199.1 branched-chain amino acid aminotransferase [Clostridium botulinum]MCD3235045.1 branched-chain amino acid transaminase [Clostridium botulinum D/C]MCD3240982.1 branched-chain amino acid transaminase [Clostridium botulinum D/C]MCD3268413.1 branched-chain amino acid transaminase [Clostridium botulinum D/C]